MQSGIHLCNRTAETLVPLLLTSPYPPDLNSFLLQLKIFEAVGEGLTLLMPFPL